MSVLSGVAYHFRKQSFTTMLSNFGEIHLDLRGSVGKVGGERRRMVVACRSGLAVALKGVVDADVELMVFGTSGDVDALGGLIEAADPDLLVLEPTPTGPGSLALAARLQQQRPGLRVFVVSEVAAAPQSADPEGLGGLTGREIQVLRLLSEGLDLKSISRVLGISLHTTRGHVKNLLTKLGAHSQLEAVVTANRRGYLAPVSAG